jgi:UrcA family protein
MSTYKLDRAAGVVAAAVLATAIAIGPSAAFAAVSDDQVTVRVSTADLNMASEAGAQVALARIRQAARDICGDEGGRVSLTVQTQMRRCVDGVVERAVASSNQPALLAVSQGRRVTQTASAAR